MFKERSEEWLKFRKGYISATEIASLVGVNSYMTANQLLKEKYSETVEKLDNEHIRDGVISEAATFKALQLLGWELHPLSPEGKVVVFTDEDLKISSTPDNFRWDVPAVVEVKKTTVPNFEKNWLGGCPPLRYLAQIQAQMHTTGMHEGFLVCLALVDNVPVSIYRVNYLASFIDVVEEGLSDFHAADRTKRLMVPGDRRETAAELLKQSYTHIGVFRHKQGYQESMKEQDLDEVFT